MALMGKWGWRAIEGEGAVWLNVAVDNRSSIGIGLSGINAITPGIKRRGWWGDVLECLRDNVGSWFIESLDRRVSNGERTSFWKDKWVGDSSLRVQFPKLFDLCLQKDVSVKGVGRWEDDVWRWGVGWRRGLREWEILKLNELTMLLKCRKSNITEADQWRWNPEASGNFSVRSSYRTLLERKGGQVLRVPSWARMLWKSWVTPKAKVAAWRALVGRIAVKAELVKRGALAGNSDLSWALCGEEVETINHLFMECNRT